MKKLLPHLKDVTKAGAYGNEAPAFFGPRKDQTSENPKFCDRFDIKPVVILIDGYINGSLADEE